MEQDFPIGTRIRLTNNVRRDFQGKMATIVPCADLKISWPSTTSIYHDYVIRLDDMREGHLHWGARAQDTKFIEEPERPMRCYASKRELDAHMDALRRLVRSLKKGDCEHRDELLRNADAAIGKITKMLALSGPRKRGVAKKSEKSEKAKKANNAG